MLKIKLSCDFDLRTNLLCGQIFRVEEEDNNKFIVILEDRVIRIFQDKKILYVESNNYNNLENVIINYFDLNRDYSKINNELLKINPNLKDIIDKNKTLKFIKQPKFECIISYVLSSNNTVKNIKNALDNISKRYGKKVIFDNKEYYLFPSFYDLKDAKVEDFRELKCGFRDKYLVDIIKNINNKSFDIEKISLMEDEVALKYLTNQKGIGLKVASCILLFAYSKFGVYPIDTWVKHYMKDNYNIEDVKEIKEYFSKYNNYSGIIIQYIFNYYRNERS